MTPIVPPPALTDGTLTLCPLTAGVAVPFAEAVRCSAPMIRAWMSTAMAPETPGAVDAYVAEWEAARAAGTGYGFAAFGPDAACVGFGLINAVHAHHRFGNVGYWVRSDAVGQGYGVAITRLLARFGFGTLGLHRLELVIEPDNAPSRRVAEKVGAVYEGRLRHRLCVDGAVRDALLYSLLPTDIAS